MKSGSKIAIPAGVPKELYRTKLCNSYKNGQVCNYKEKCFFAHGEKELRQMVSVISNDDYCMHVAERPAWHLV